EHQHASVIRRLLFYMIENDNRHGDVAFFQFQSQLLFERVKERDTAVRDRRSGLPGSCSQRGLGWGHTRAAETQSEVKGALDPSGVQHLAANESPGKAWKLLGKFGHGHVLTCDQP